MLKTIKIKSEILLRKLGAKFGFDFKMTDEERLIRLLEFNGIDLVVDVGANTGQYAQELFSFGYKGKIVSIEPLSDAYNILKKKTENNPRWITFDRCALGNEDGNIEINISENPVSSSILKVMNTHTDSEPGANIKSTENTLIYKFDTIAKKVLMDSKNTYFKIDTQGYEENILNGALQSIKLFKGIQVEMSFIQLYEGQKLYIDLINILNDHGFSIQSIEPAFTDKKSGRLLQVNGIFFRE